MENSLILLAILACRPSLAAPRPCCQLRGNQTPYPRARPNVLPSTPSQNTNQHLTSDRLNQRLRRVSSSRNLCLKKTRHQWLVTQDLSVYFMTKRHTSAHPGCPLSLLFRKGYRLIVAVLIRQKALVSEGKSCEGGPRHHLRRRVQFFDTLPRISAFEIAFAPSHLTIPTASCQHWCLVTLHPSKTSTLSQIVGRSRSTLFLN